MSKGTRTDGRPFRRKRPVAKRVVERGFDRPRRDRELLYQLVGSGACGERDERDRAKLKTFVRANGALLAEQEVVEYQQTNYEILRFVHQDASGSGVQQTLANGTLALPNGRTAEYDARWAVT